MHTALGKPQAVIAEEPASDGNETELQSARTDGVIEAGANKKRGMVLPFEPHSITFDNVVYSVDMPQVIFLLEDFGSLMQETSY